jgi:hypothetical protein
MDLRAEVIRFVAYHRVPAGKQRRSGLGLEAQREAVARPGVAPRDVVARISARAQ